MFTHNLGFPRIGKNRELKRLVESFWQDKINEDELLLKLKDLQIDRLRQQKDTGIDLISVGDFSLYDHVLDTSLMFGLIPKRFRNIGLFKDDGCIDIKSYFLMARGGSGLKAMAMTKWFDTNYHYIIPEIYPDLELSLYPNKLLDEIRLAKSLEIEAKPVIIGPLTFIYLSREEDESFDKWKILDQLVPLYKELFRVLSSHVSWIQIDEPILVLDLDERIKGLFKDVYKDFTQELSKVNSILATYFEGLDKNLSLATSLPVKFLHLDLIRAPYQLDDALKEIPDTMGLSLGLIDGRNIWKTDLYAALDILKKAEKSLSKERLCIAPSCSLLHVPVDLELEDNISNDIKIWLSFAIQKLKELRILADSFLDSSKVSEEISKNKEAIELRKRDKRTKDPRVRDRISNITKDMYERENPYSIRSKLQHKELKLPVLPTTTIGSFPQDQDIRKTRKDFILGKISKEDYEEKIKGIIKKVIKFQEDIDLDVLVHGEPERSDMVEYFAQLLDGFITTQNGWVQSYGTRCVRPPIIYADVFRANKMTVSWISYAQSLTKRPVKGMLTGPVTMLNWSFVRDDIPRKDVCVQIALAIRDEVKDLEDAGIKVIQIDEPALREAMPLKRHKASEYLDWAVSCFRLASSCVSDSTQIHTHMCYSYFNDIMEWIAKMDADVISIEASRSKMKLLKAFRDFKYPNEIGPGVYDIHSPRVPSVDEIKTLIEMAMEVIPYDRLWVNPDCGLKTRNWPEVIDSLKNMVAATKEIRNNITQKL